MSARGAGRKNCMREVLWATCLQRPVVLVLEADASKGGITLEEVPVFDGTPPWDPH